MLSGPPSLGLCKDLSPNNTVTCRAHSLQSSHPSAEILKLDREERHEAEHEGGSEYENGCHDQDHYDVARSLLIAKEAISSGHVGAPVGKVDLIGDPHTGRAQTSLRVVYDYLLAQAKVKHDDLSDDGGGVEGLCCDKDKEVRVVLGADARVKPRTVMVISLDALLAHVAVIAARQGNHSALEAELTSVEAL